jgi:hypothetical protein
MLFVKWQLYCMTRMTIYIISIARTADCFARFHLQKFVVQYLDTQISKKICLLSHPTLQKRNAIDGLRKGRFMVAGNHLNSMVKNWKFVNIFENIHFLLNFFTLFLELLIIIFNTFSEDSIFLKSSNIFTFHYFFS